IVQHGLSMTRPLSSLLTAEEFARLDVAAKSIGATGEQLNIFRPWLAGLTLSVAPLAKAGYDPASGVELTLKSQAEAAGKSIHGFESLADQIQVLAGLPEDEQLIFLRSTLEDYDEAVTMIDGMVAAWSAGDVAALDRLVVEDMKGDSPVIYRALLVDRNADWVQQIQGILAGSGTAFIAVGAAHLAGEDSVQAMLQTKGVTVERLE
ncbi:MAG: TraB/GumN family protein, partial [Brevundimonas sp.]